MTQITKTVLMIRPVQFRMNEQTAVNNYYQKVLEDTLPETVNTKAVAEFDTMVTALKNAGIQVIVVEDSKEFDTPDSIFPNNWISFHKNGTIGLYPMFAKNRRLERKDSILEAVEAEGFKIETVVDYSAAEDDGYYLEGTGSILLDRENQKAYCALSERADEELFIEFCEDFEYTPVIFSAYQTVNNKRELIYHTNVMMCLGTTFAVVCLASIDDKKERKNLLNHLHEDGKKVIEISEEQVNNFAGNMLQLKGTNDQSYLVMSQSALESLRPAQVQLLEVHATIISSKLDTIEACGGGSARCMMAEVFLPKTASN
ncbi:arginine deiminase-related protein [Flavobacteriaceae bacterium]|nr:arginine deiminase-related protein [Flavobacteriaceae bacterium]